MKHYKLSDLKVGMRVYVDELTEIEGIYILLSDTEVHEIKLVSSVLV